MSKKLEQLESIEKNLQKTIKVMQVSGKDLEARFRLPYHMKSSSAKENLLSLALQLIKITQEENEVQVFECGVYERFEAVIKSKYSNDRTQKNELPNKYLIVVIPNERQDNN